MAGSLIPAPELMDFPAAECVSDSNWTVLHFSIGYCRGSGPSATDQNFLNCRAMQLLNSRLCLDIGTGQNEEDSRIGNQVETRVVLCHLSNRDNTETTDETAYLPELPCGSLPVTGYAIQRLSAAVLNYGHVFRNAR